MRESAAGVRHTIQRSQELIEQSMAALVMLDSMIAEFGRSTVTGFACRVPAPASRAACWERSGQAFYTSICDLAGLSVIHGVAEALPYGQWTWLVWKADTIRSGLAVTAQQAMRSAEFAAADL